MDNKYNPNIVVTMPKGSVNLIPIYSNTNERNNIGYTLTDLYNNDTIFQEYIIVISGEVGLGFVITDINDHIYTITSITENQIINIKHITVKDKGK